MAFKKLIIGILFTLYPLSSLAAIDCDRTTLVAAIAAAGVGDTITCNAGSWTWASAVSISKEIKLIGAGIGLTNITCSGGNCITSGYGEANNIRISGFTFTYGVSAGDLLWIDGTGFRIDNNRFISTAAWAKVTVTSGVADVHPTGVIYKNQFVETAVLVWGTQATLGDNNWQNRLWAVAMTFGDANATYVEGNTFTKSMSGDANIVDANYGGRVVARYNTILTDSGASGSCYFWEMHSAGAYRGPQKFEIYNNVQTCNSSGASFFTPFNLRGGMGLVFNNTTSGNYTSGLVYMTNWRSYEAVGPGGLCDGDSTGWDGNEITEGNGAGYPCRDQIGRGYDTVLWVNDPPGAYTQVKVPMYLWNNTFDGGNMAASVAAGTPSYHIAANRDYYDYTAAFDGTTGTGRGTLAARPGTCTIGVGYFATDQGRHGTLYKCTALNEWSSYYTPYTCPHPSTGLTGKSCGTGAGVGYYELGNVGFGAGAVPNFTTGAAITLQ